jgi:hypothetical protein
LNMTTVEILRVEVATPQPGDTYAGYIDHPVAGSQSDAHSLDVWGWFMSREAEVRLIRVAFDGIGLVTTNLDVPRPDVKMYFGLGPEAETCGYSIRVNLLGVAPDFELTVQAELADRQLRPIGVIHGRQKMLATTFVPQYAPLLVTRMGRSGSTWLMRLLAQHPAVVVHRAYPHEVNILRYWLHALSVLSAPADTRHSARPDNFSLNRYWVGHNPYHAPPATDVDSLRQWLGHAYVEDLATFCQHSIETFYRHIAISQGQPNARYFAEKVRIDRIPNLTWELYPQAREVFLVRDLRDVLCSVKAFNAKRGYPSFGYEFVDHDADFVNMLRVQGVQLVQSWRRRQGKAFWLHYENLILKPEESLTRLLQYLDLDSSPSLVGDMLKRARNDTPQMFDHRTSGDIHQSIGRWRRDLDDNLQAICQNLLSDVLQDLGYPA